MFLASNLEKTKENQCFCFPRASGDPGGTIGPTTPKKKYITNPRSTAQAGFTCNRSKGGAWELQFRFIGVSIWLGSGPDPFLESKFMIEKIQLLFLMILNNVENFILCNST